MRLTFAATALFLATIPVGAQVARNDNSTEVTIFAAGDVADCSLNNPSLIAVSSLDDEEIAEHRMDLDSRLPREPLDVEELVEDEPGIVLGLIALNSEIDAGTESQQAAFLEQDLAAAGHSCILAYFHKPAFASLERPYSEHARELFQLLDHHEAALVLNGHNHYYERTALLDGAGKVAAEGIREFVGGTGEKANTTRSLTLPLLLKS